VNLKERLLELERYRERAMEFLSTLRMEKYLYRAGRKDRLEVDAIFRAHEELWQNDTVKELVDLHEGANPEEEKRIRFLLAFAVQQALGQTGSTGDQELAAIESDTSIDLGNQSLHFHEATIQLSSDENRSRRREIFEKRLTVIESGNEIRRIRLRDMIARAEELDSKGLVSLFQRASGFNFSVLRTQLDNFLTHSESYYSSHLERYANRFLGLSSHEIEPWDEAFLFSGHAYDALFPEDRMLSILKRTLMGMGFDLKKMQNIVIDAKDRPSKSTVPRCVRVRVPREVYLVLRPQGGMFDFLSLMNKAGQALHAAHILESEPFEYRYLGDPAVPETSGYLFQYITLNQDWLLDYLRIDYDHDFRDFNQFRKLYLLRAAAARFLFELETFESMSKQPESLSGLYQQKIRRALHVPAPAGMHLYDIDVPFYETRYLRAWIFESEMREILTQRFGSRWYSRPIAGHFLQEVWASSLRYGCDELAQRIRNWGLSMDAITREIS